MTATARGSSIGRSDAAVARRWRASAETTPSADGVSVERDVDAAGRRFRSNLESRVAKHLEHRVVVGERRRLEAAEAVAGGDRGEPLEQLGRETFAVKAIVDGERRFGDARAGREVGADGDEPRVVADLPHGDERDAALFVRRVAQPLHQRHRAVRRR